LIDGKSEKPTRTPIQTLAAKDFEHDELFESLQRWQVLVLAVVLAVLASVDVEVVVVVVVVVTFFYCFVVIVLVVMVVVVFNTDDDVAFYSFPCSNKCNRPVSSFESLEGPSNLSTQCHVY
jgi:type IV secretory pathway VirB3-like protein